MIRLRAVAAMLALVLFPLFVLAVLAGAVWAVVLLAGSGHSSLPAVKLLLIPLVFAVYWAVKDVRSLKPGPSEAPAVTRAQQPRLWAEIDRLAEVAQTAAPDRVVIVPEVNAAVSEVGGQREMVIGLPLLAGMSVGQLRSVLAHELGHYAGGDTAAAARTYRWTVLLHRVRDNATGVVRWLLSAYVWFFARVSAASNRDVERAADSFSVRVAGPETAAAAMRRIAEVDVAWSMLNSSYVPLFEPAGARAPLHAGVRAFLDANPERVAEAVDEHLAQERRRATDTHPTLRERIADFEARAAAGEAAADPAAASSAEAHLPATSLLDDADAWLGAVESGLLVQERELVTWDEVVRRAGAQTAAASAGEITHHLEANGAVAGRDLGSALSLLDRADAAPFGSWFTDGPAERVERAGHEVLGTLVEAALVGAGAARHQLSWTGPWSVVDEDGTPVQSGAVVHAALSEPDGPARLRAWLVERGVDPSVAATGRIALRPRLLAATTLMTGPWEGRRDGLFWSTGLLFVDPGDEATSHVPGAQSRSRQQERVGYAAAEGLEALQSRPGSLWIPVEDVRSARVRGLVDPKVDLRLGDDSVVELRSKVDSESFEEPHEALRMLFADRLVDARV